MNLKPERRIKQQSSEDIIEKLDRKLALGEISEATYRELREKYEK